MAGYLLSAKYNSLPYWILPFLQLYHNSSECEPDGRDGDDSRPEEFRKLVSLNQGRFLVLVHEALGLDYRTTLNSSFSLIEVMMQEYAYVIHERNKKLKKEKDEDGREFEWVELPSFDNPKEMIRYKKYKDLQK